MGKEKRYLLYEEVNDMLPSEISSSDELDDIFSMFGSMGIEVVDSEQKFREKAEGEEGAELEIAKRIERGKKAVMKVITRTPMSAQVVAGLADRLQKSEITVRDVVVFNKEEVTEEKLEAKIRETLKLADKVAQAHRDYLAYRKKFVELSKRSPRYPR